MHTLFILLALLFAAAASLTGALLLRLTPPGERRSLALMVLTAPVFIFGMAASHAVPRLWTDCEPLVGWDRMATLGLMAAVGGTLLLALAWNLGRALLVQRLLNACGTPSRARLDRLETLARQAGVRVPALRVLTLDGPLAATGGFPRPSIVLSDWVLDHLDARELDAVLAHELAHLGRWDHVVRWMAHVLRDATIYLPGAWYALRVLERDQELRADAVALRVTHRPLALASSLVKMWQAVGTGTATPSLGSLPSFGGHGYLIEERLRCVLAADQLSGHRWRGRALAGAAALSVGAFGPRALAAMASALPLMCSLRPGFGL